MTDALVANFVDGSDAETSIFFDQKRVKVTAFDEKTSQWYHLTFRGCVKINITYSDVEDEWADLNNLTEGIRELKTLEEGFRRFEIGFVDESIIQIDCREFSMEPISKPLPGIMQP